MAFLSRGVLAALFLVWMTALGLAADRAIIVLDASGSMWGQIDGRPKVDIARETLRTVLQSVPADMELGLMAYGHREKGSCVDIELVVPPAAGSAPAITSAADAMKFLGKTPLTAAVRQAAEALRYTGREIDRHPDHRRHRDLRGRSLRARQGAGSRPASTSPPMSSASA